MKSVYGHDYFRSDTAKLLLLRYDSLPECECVSILDDNIMDA